MSSIIPISKLQDDPYKISKQIHSQKDPIFITKDGYGDMVLMSFDSYEELKMQAEQKAALSKIGSSNVSIDYNDNREDNADDKALNTDNLEKLPMEDVLKILKDEVERQHKGYKK